MGYQKDIYRRIREEYEHKYLDARAAADSRRSEVHLAIPEVAAIDRQMQGVGLKIMKAAMDGGDYQAKLAALRAENQELLRRRGAALVAGGYPADYTEVRYDCKRCSDAGYVDGRMCLCMRRRLADAALEASGMAHLIKSQSFENFNLDYYMDDPAAYRRMEQIKQRMEKYAREFDPAQSDSLVLFGHTGLGKTHLSTALAKVVIDRGFDVFYAPALTVLADFEHQRFGNESGEITGQDTNRYYECELLIIDDLGTEICNQFTTSVIYNIINNRLNRHLPTIISTNLTQSEFQKRYWDRITSRVLGEYAVLPFLGSDIRAQKLNRNR